MTRQDFAGEVLAAADAVVDGMLISLTAGETHHFIVRTSQRLREPSTLSHRRVLRCANTSVSGVSPTTS